MTFAANFAANFANARRDSGALVITIGVHALVGAAALLAVVGTAPTRVPPPIITTNHPDPVTARPADPPPSTSEVPITARLDEPVIIIDNPAPAKWENTATGEPPIAGPGPSTAPGPIVVDPPQPPALPGQPARFDPRFAAMRQPPYPAAARRLSEAGNVLVRVRIGSDGRVVAASLAQSSGFPRLDAAAIDHALKHWRFTPATEAGQAVAAERTITVTFRLDQG